MWQEAQETLSKDKFIGPLIVKYGPCQIKKLKKSQYFEDLVSAICGQQLSVKAASTIFGRLKTKLGGKVTPEAVLAQKEGALRSCGLSFAKIKYCKDLAQRVLDGRLKIKLLDKLSDEEVLKELIEVKGIGRWTAEMFLMFSLGRPDIFPVDDLGIQKGVKSLVGKELSKKDLSEFGVRFAPWRSIASWYIWKILDNT